MNDLTISDISQVLNDVVSQATGKTIIAPLDGSQFATVAKLGLEVGYDPLANSISQVLSRTIFSERRYVSKFAPLRVSEQRWGNMTRKLNAIDSEFTTDERLPLNNGESVDMYKINKPKILQTNFYGAVKYARFVTVFKDQWDTALSSAEEYGRLISFILGNISDQIEQAHESMARQTVCNFVAGKIETGGESVIHLLTEYNARSGEVFTQEDIYKPENFSTFMKWVSGRIKGIMALMTERSQMLHTNVTGKEISRHTPYQNQRLYLYSPEVYQMQSSVLSDVFNDEYVKLAKHEPVNFWQSIKTPNEIDMKPIFLKPDGTLGQATDAKKYKNIFGVIHDEEAMGLTTVNKWSMATPMNASGGYHNLFFHFTDRYWNDFTENGIVLLID